MENEENINPSELEFLLNYYLSLKSAELHLKNWGTAGVFGKTTDTKYLEEKGFLLNRIGYFYSHGLGTDVDYKKANTYYLQASVYGSIRADINRIVLYYHNTGANITASECHDIIENLINKKCDECILDLETIISETLSTFKITPPRDMFIQEYLLYNYGLRKIVLLAIKGSDAYYDSAKYPIEDFSEHEKDVVDKIYKYLDENAEKDTPYIDIRYLESFEKVKLINGDSK